jgi:hypothetical protein
MVVMPVLVYFCIPDMPQIRGLSQAYSFILYCGKRLPPRRNDLKSDLSSTEEGIWRLSQCLFVLYEYVPLSIPGPYQLLGQMNRHSVAAEERARAFVSFQFQ